MAEEISKRKHFSGKGYLHGSPAVVGLTHHGKCKQSKQQQHSSFGLQIFPQKFKSYNITHPCEFIKIELNHEGNVPAQTSEEKSFTNDDKLQETKAEDPSATANAAGDLQLDICSEQFNSLKALYASDYRVSAKQPKVIYQNMAAFETALKRVGIYDVGKRPKGHSATTQAGSSKKATVVEEDVRQRRFQEHQMAIRRETKPKGRHNRNILTQMAQDEGPLKALQSYVAHNKRVHVIVRKEKGIKGYVEGTLEMYDRHWNLLLTDVEESYEYRKYKYAYDDVVYHTEKENCAERLEELGITLPKVAVKSLGRKVVQTKRHLPQLMLRGEHVVLVYVKEEKVGK